MICNNCICLQNTNNNDNTNNKTWSMVYISGIKKKKKNSNRYNEELFPNKSELI